MTELRAGITKALSAAGRKITSAELYALLGTEEPRPKVMATLTRMKNEGEVKAFAGDSPRKTLYATIDSAGAPKANGSKSPKAASKPAKTKAKTPPPEAKATSPPAPACNVADFTPALTADRRLVIVGGSEPLIFSPEQTQNIATLMLDRFEA